MGGDHDTTAVLTDAEREVLAARLFLADEGHPHAGPWVSLPEEFQRPYRAQAQAAQDYYFARLAAQPPQDDPQPACGAVDPRPLRGHGPRLCERTKGHEPPHRQTDNEDDRAHEWQDDPQPDEREALNAVLVDLFLRLGWGATHELITDAVLAAGFRRDPDVGLRARIETVLDVPPSDDEDWLSTADYESVARCNCGHCDADEGHTWCPMAVRALVEQKVEDRDEQTRAALAEPTPGSGVG